MAEKTTQYYVPESSPWPLMGSIGLLLLAVGGANFIQQHTDKVQNDGKLGGVILAIGVLWMIGVMFMWWRDTVKESLGGLHSHQMDRSYRQGMIWFIFSEVMFFGAFFGALFYTRWLIVPWLGGAGSNAMTHELLWPNFQAMWPLLVAPDGRTTAAMGAWGLPAINTAILLTSSITLTIAHHALLANQRGKVIAFQAATIVLAVIFLGLQALEYVHAYHMGLTIDAGIYGSLFFLMTGFHGAHVFLGTIFMIVTFLRVLKGHYTPENHFAWEAAAWYWHFVDVVWLFLFVAVYWL
ncbi:cytochrome c oxidase subunit III [Alcanivorax sp. S71-1-4]|jgi:cytochrome c oxidase subunit III|uniref:cytochrome c oxidase subunit 3 n=1 Tax=Alcanivorax sp. S71-1-4 TaxID=1177159 RepID=UPI001357436C|nr:cytochrome c oxidase subunit 3 [Alcanivorax sp. S71-1-4]KAF0807541.1 cytochrome c oxidase subunit III [Alcanivorax sp. S71-1-4]